MKVLVTALLRSQKRKCRKSLRARIIVNWNHRGSWIQKRKPMLREQKKFQEVSLRDLLLLGEPETRLWACTRWRDKTGTSPWRQVTLILASVRRRAGEICPSTKGTKQKTSLSLCHCLNKKSDQRLSSHVCSLLGLRFRFASLPRSKIPWSENLRWF